MKKFLYISLLMLVPMSLYPQKTTRDSLREELNKTTDINKRLTLLTNLTDISRDKSQAEYAKLLLREAEKNRNDYYKEIAFTEILRYYTNHDVPDSVTVYLNKAEASLKKSNYKQALLSFIRTMADVRTVFYTDSPKKKKILEDNYYRLKSDKKMSPIDRISANYIIGMSLVTSPILEIDGKKIRNLRGYFEQAIAVAEKMPTREGSLFLPNILFMAINSTKAMPAVQTRYTRQYYKIVTDWYHSPEMQKRPYYTKRHLINANSTMAMTGPVLGKSTAELYYNQFVKLNKSYPEDANLTPLYEYLFTSINYYGSNGEYRKELPLLDRMISLLTGSPYQADRIVYLQEKIKALKQLGEYKEALDAYDVYAVLRDSSMEKEINNRVEQLDIQKNVNALIKENKALEMKATGQRNVSYLLGICIILAFIFLLVVFFRFIRQRSLSKALKESNEKLIEADIKVRESEAMKTSFIRSMSHEVRTPLNAINGFAELVSDEGIPMEERNKFSRIIHDNCFQLTTILNGLLEVAQLDSSRQEMRFSKVNLNDLCHMELDNVLKFERKSNIDYSVSTNDETKEATIETNRPYIGIVLNHLLMNANKFTNEGKITIGYDINEDNTSVMIFVSDTGIGISSENHEWVFDKFTKGNRFEKGIGLGLYLCRQIVTRLNGIIKVDPDYDKGTRIVITLPVRQQSTLEKTS